MESGILYCDEDLNLPFKTWKIAKQLWPRARKEIAHLKWIYVTLVTSVTSKLQGIASYTGDEPQERSGWRRGIWV